MQSAEGRKVTTYLLQLPTKPGDLLVPLQYAWWWRRQRSWWFYMLPPCFVVAIEHGAESAHHSRQINRPHDRMHNTPLIVGILHAQRGRRKTKVCLFVRSSEFLSSPVPDRRVCWLCVCVLLLCGACRLSVLGRHRCSLLTKPRPSVAYKLTFQRYG